ncbi:MAG: c-type cytochrome [Burkholderiales bacterium]
MPAFGTQLADQDIWSVLAYIKHIWPDKIRAAQEEITRGARKP